MQRSLEERVRHRAREKALELAAILEEEKSEEWRKQERGRPCRNTKRQWLVVLREPARRIIEPMQDVFCKMRVLERRIAFFEAGKRPLEQSNTALHITLGSQLPIAEMD